MYRVRHLAAAAATLALFATLTPDAAAGIGQKSAVRIHINGSYAANGVLVDSEWVLTAAHVVHGKNPAAFSLYVGGEPDLCDLDAATPLYVDAFTTPDDPFSVCGNGYNPVDYTNDIALLHLEFPAPFSQDVQPVALATTGTDVLPGELVHVEGRWGSNACGGVPAGCERKELDLQVLSKVATDAVLGMAFPLTPCQFGAIDPAPLPSEAPWYGSTGAGAFKQVGSATLLVGIRSYYVSSGGCILGSKPGVFTRISQYSAWISSVAGKPAPPVDIGGSGVPPGSGCGAMQLSSTGGTPSPGNLSFALEVHGMPTGGFVGLVINVGTTTSSLPWNGGALHTTAGGFFWHWNGFMVSTGSSPCSGSATFPFPIPYSPDLIGVQVTPQGLFVDAVALTPTNAITFAIQ